MLNFANLKRLMTKNMREYSHLVMAPAVIVSCLMMMVMGSSCFGDEPDGCEADIEIVTLHVSNPANFFFQSTDSMQTVFSTDSVM